MKKNSLVVGLLFALVPCLGCDPPQQADSQTETGNAGELANNDSVENETPSHGNDSGSVNEVGGVNRMAARSGVSLGLETGSSSHDPSNIDTRATTNDTRVPADVGVGKQGRKTIENAKAGGIKRMIAQPAASLFAFRQAAVFKIQVPQAMNLYRASNGHFPKTHDDFMQLMKEQMIRLPELPFGQTYEYDAESSQLMVNRPANN